MKRNLFVAVFIFCIITAFAKTKTAKVPPTTNISDSDVISFANNFEKLMHAFDSYEDVTEEMDSQQLEALIGKDEMNRVYESYGISGPDSSDKVDMMILCYSKIKLEKEMKNAPFFLQGTIGKKIKKLFDEKINPDDETVVSRHMDLLNEKIGDLLEEED